MITWVETGYLNIEDEPTENGWYALIRCWEPQEGLFPTCGKWQCDPQWNPKREFGTGTFEECRIKTFRTAVCYRSSEPFKTPQAAKKWAYENDMENEQ